jgi:hypothetical protein
MFSARRREQRGAEVIEIDFFSVACMSHLRSKELGEESRVKPFPKEWRQKRTGQITKLADNKQAQMRELGCTSCGNELLATETSPKSSNLLPVFQISSHEEIRESWVRAVGKGRKSQMIDSGQSHGCR